MTDDTHRRATPEPAISSPFTDGAGVGIGSLPHGDGVAAASFAIREFEIATIPTLPNRSIAEGMLAQAVAGMPGISVDLSGAVVVDAECTAIGDVAQLDLRHDAYVGFRSFLEHASAAGLNGSPIKWQYVGPVTLGVALQRAGLEVPTAFDLAGTAVRAQLVGISDAVSTILPNSPQMVVLDEPWFADLMTPGFPIPPDEAMLRCRPHL